MLNSIYMKPKFILNPFNTSIFRVSFFFLKKCNNLRLQFSWFRYFLCTSWRVSIQEMVFMNGCYVNVNVWNEYLDFRKMDIERVRWSTFSVLPPGKLQGHPLEVKEQKLQITGCVHIKAYKIYKDDTRACNAAFIWHPKGWYVLQHITSLLGQIFWAAAAKTPIHNSIICCQVLKQKKQLPL